MNIKTLLILAHPAKNSLCEILADKYLAKTKEEGREIRYVKLKNLQFDLNLHEGYSGEQPLEQDLENVKADILWCNHLVIIFPTWWGTYPALLKGFIDRIFLPGFAYKYHKGKLFQEKLLKGKSGHLITTMNAPSIYYDLFYFGAGIRSLKTAVFDFCGIYPVRVTKIDNVRKLKTEDIEKINIY
jgi:putative NADPH-quinone reductase